MSFNSDDIDSELAEHLTKKIAKGGSIVFSGKVLQRGLAFTLHLLLARFLGSGSYGVYSLGRSTINLASKFSSLGLQNGLVRFVSLYQGKEEESKTKGTLISALAIVAVISIPASVFIYLFSQQISTYVFNEPQLVRVLHGFSIAFPFYVFVSVVSAGVRGFQKMNDYVSIQLGRSFTDLLFVSIAFLLGFRIGGAIFGFITSAMVSALLGSYLLIKNFPDLISDLKPTFNLRRLFRFSLPMYLAGFSYLILSRTDIFMLGYFLESSNVGVYRAVVNLTNLVNFALVAFNTAFAPMISDLYSQNRISELGAIYKTVTRWVFLSSAILTLFLASHASEFLSVFGTDFKVGAPAVIILALFQLACVSVGSVGFMLQMSGHQDYVLANNVGTALTNVALNYLLIPKFGIMGAAIATGSAFALNNFAGLIEVYLLLKVHPWNLDYLKPVLAGLISGAFFFLFSVFNLYWLIALALMGLIYLVVLILQGLPKADRLVIRAVIEKIFS